MAADVSRETTCQCPGCRNELVHAATGRPRRFCSERCRKRAARPLPVLATSCAWCEGPMPDGITARREFCSHSCAARASERRLAS